MTPAGAAAQVIPFGAREAECSCSKCGEGLYFVPGIRGPERWRHCRTEAAACEPLCQTCGAPGEVKIGHYSVDGGQMPVFVLSHWECGRCAAKTCRIEHV